MSERFVSRIDELLVHKSGMVGEKVSVEDVARAVGVSRQTMYNWMSPDGVDRLPAAVHEARLERFFGVATARIWRLTDAVEEAV